MSTQPTWIGQTLGGRYQIEDLLGQGGMAAVYRALDPNLQRVVAIKLIHTHLSSNQEFVRRFEEEARRVAQLRHPNIVQVYDFNHDGDVYFIVFEFVAGETLQARLRRLNEQSRLLELQDAIHFAASTGDALDYAHNRELIHRDVKPANVMLDVHGQAILTDFGIAKIMGGTQHTATGAVLGTARYMSPEQIRGQKVDHRTDIYSLGVLLYEAVSGRPPYDADSVMTLMMRHIEEPIPDLQEARPDVPLGLAAVVNRAMAKYPDQRFDTAGEFSEALREVRLDGSSGAELTMVEPPVAEMTVVEPAPSEIMPAEVVSDSVSQTAPPPAGPPDMPGETAGGAEAPGLGQRPTIEPAHAGSGTTTLKPGPSGIDAVLQNRPLVIGVVAAALVLIAGIIFVPGLLGGGDGGLEPTAVAGIGAEPTETTDADQAAAGGEVAATATDRPSPTATRALPTATTPATATAVPATATTAATATTRPTATYTPPPPTNTAPPPTPTQSGPLVRITNITVRDGRYFVDYTTVGYTEVLPGMHVHFFWNNISPEQAGVGPSQASWFVWGGPRPFDGYAVSDRPSGVTQMCAIVANPDHTGQPTTGNCFGLP